MRPLRSQQPSQRRVSVGGGWVDGGGSAAWKSRHTFAFKSFAILSPFHISAQNHTARFNLPDDSSRSPHALTTSHIEVLYEADL